jgi:hypothetical protein
MNASDSITLSGNVKEVVSRDLIALGGMPFYLLIIVRASIGDYPYFLSHVAIALPVVYLFSRIVKGSNLHIARALILVVFTSLFYEHLPFTIFASLVWVFMILSLYYLKVSGREIVKGIAAGVVSAAISYLLTMAIAPLWI